MVVELVQPKLSAQERVDRLHVFSESSPDLAGQLAAAFALDEPNSREVYREFLLASTRKIVSPPDATQLAERSTLALVIALDSGNETDSANAATQEHTISSADLWWLVRFHAQKRSSRLKAVLQNALDRKICEHPRRIFLLVARDAEVATDTPYEALIAAAQHGPTVQDVVRFSGWLAPQSEQALYAVLLATADSAVAIAALDGLRSKPQLDQLVVEMVNLVRAQGDSRVLEYAPLLGALGLRGMLEESLVVEGLKSVSDKPSIDQFAQKIFELGDAKIISAALPLYGSLVNPSLLLPLLGNADQRVRIRTVPLLKDLPLASSRAELSRMYAAERDPSVRAVYEQQGLSSP
jgi:hypothetical protein